MATIRVMRRAVTELLHADSATLGASPLEWRLPADVGGDVWEWWVVTTGNPTSVSVKIETSADGAKWTVFDTITVTDGTSIVTGKPEKIRVNVVSFTGGVAPTAAVYAKVA